MLSRFKGPKQIVASEEDTFLPYVDLDDTVYSELVAEVPHIREHWRAMRERDREGHIAMPYLKERPRRPLVPAYEESEEAGAEAKAVAGQIRLDNRNEVNVTRLSGLRSTPKSLPLPLTLPLNGTRRSNANWHWGINFDTSKFLGPRVATCYVCNVYTDRTPVSPVCHDAFQSDDWKHKTYSRYFIGKCYDNSKYNYYTWAKRKETASLYHEDERYHDSGLVTQYYGYFTGGCFKRWTDVGKVYTYRGCRQWPAFTGTYNYVSHRFRRLQLLLQKEKDACIHSPQASLTPFNRGISLFVRYHVCVCSEKLCNHSTRTQPYSHLLILMLLYVLLSGLSGLTNFV